MRRSIIQLLLLAAAAAAAFSALAIAGPAGAAPRSPAIICPKQAAAVEQPMIVSCCPVPTSATNSQANAQPPCCATCCATTCCPPTVKSGACCAQTTCPPPGLTISSSPNPSKAGQKVVISGTAGSGAQVTLWRKLAKQSGFHQVSQTTADSSGSYTFTQKRGTVMADQDWYVTSSGTQSATVTQRVAALVALDAFRVARTVVLRGHVTPSHAGEVVLVEMSRGGAWQVLARPRLGRGSGYAVSHHFARSGVVRLRVVLKADRRNERSVSPAVRLSVPQ